MNAVVATPVVEAKGKESQVIEAHGARIPVVGLGTWNLRGRSCAGLVEQALRLGYRHVDTAEMYDNEREVGEGVRASGIAQPASAGPRVDGLEPQSMTCQRRVGIFLRETEPRAARPERCPLSAHY
jgi:hypothetical protein